LRICRGIRSPIGPTCALFKTVMGTEARHISGEEKEENKVGPSWPEEIRISARISLHVPWILEL
jgi:hypothetical protein